MCRRMTSILYFDITSGLRKYLYNLNHILRCFPTFSQHTERESPTFISLQRQHRPGLADPKLVEAGQPVVCFPWAAACQPSLRHVRHHHLHPPQIKTKSLQCNIMPKKKAPKSLRTLRNQNHVCVNGFKLYCWFLIQFKLYMKQKRKLKFHK